MKRAKGILIAVLCLIIVGCASYIAYYYLSQKDNEKVYEEVQKTAIKEVEEPKDTQEEPEEEKVQIPIDFATLQAQNPDIYAWIQIEGTNINYPVAQSATDNQFYLDHTIDGTAGLPGSIYTENLNSKEFTDYNTVMYGHDMRDGSMFQNLHNYADPTYMQEHPYVVIYTPTKKLTYEIFAAVTYDDRHVLYSYNFLSPDSRQQFLDSIYNGRSLGNIIRDDVQVTTNNRLLTLSTCVTGQDDKRFLVEAVLISEEK